jgi:CheY-specific phosphatase CheX
MDVSEVLGTCLTATVERVFSTMISLKTETLRIDDLGTSADENLPPVTGSVSFAGAVTGVVYFSMNTALSKALTSRISGGDSPTESEENDVIGELTNMITGNMKTALADKGYNSSLSIPSVVRGNGITLTCKGFTNAIRVSFAVPEISHEFQVRILVKLEA